MNVGMLNAASALELISKMQDAHAENLANAATTGFKKRLSSAEVFSNALRQASGLIVPKSSESLDFTEGQIRDTGEPLDVAIHGKGFFAIETPEGERYTRAGAFNQTADGFLVDLQGNKVAGETGPIQLDPARGKATIDQKGQIFQESESVGTLKIVEFKDAHQLVAESAGLFRAPRGVAPEKPKDSTVHQASLEASNVDVVDELVQMINGFRSFEAAQRTLNGIDRVKNQSVSSR